MKKINRSLLLTILVVVVLTVPTFFKLIRPGFFPMQDDLQAFRVQQMDKCFQDLQLPCRWVPDAGNQYGYPQFEYYPPSVYYLGEAFHLVGFQFIDAVKILFILGFIISTLTMFLLLRAVFGEWPAIVGSLMYSYVPYKAVEVYVRGAMSEFWSLAIFPLIFWSSYQLIKTKKIKYLAYFSLSCGALLVTHNLMSLIFFPIAAVWILVWLYLEHAWKLIPKFILGGVLGFGLAAFFSLPVLFERGYVHLDSILSGYFDYRQHFVNLGRLFIDNIWGYGSSNIGQTEKLSLSVGQIHWIVALFTVVLAIISRGKDKKMAVIIWTLAACEMVVLFMMHQKSSFIWSRIPVLVWLQFPWRFLADNIFLLSFLSGGAIYFIQLNEQTIKNKFKLSRIFGVAIVGCAFILCVSFFTPKSWLNISDKDKFSGILWQKELTISIFDYLPIYATLPPITKAPEVPEVLAGQAQFSNYHKGSNFQTGQVDVKQTATLRVPLYDFPGMKVWANGQELSHRHDLCQDEPFCYGLISINLPPGNYQLKTALTNTPVRTIGNSLTVVAVLLILGLVFKSQFYEKIHRK